MVKNTSWTYWIENFTLILVIFRKCKNSIYFSRYREKRPAKMDFANAILYHFIKFYSQKEGHLTEG